MWLLWLLLMEGVLLGPGSCWNEVSKEKIGSCHPSVLKSCLADVELLSPERRLAGLAADQVKQRLACGGFERGMHCVDNYTETCNSALERSILERKLSKVRDFFTILCTGYDNGSNPQNFAGSAGPTEHQSTNSLVERKHAFCYSKLNSEIQTCLRPLQNLRQRRPFHTHDDTIRDLCCAYRRSMNCMVIRANNFCEPAAAAGAIRNVEQTIDVKLGQQCAQVDPGQCPVPAHSSFALPSNSGSLCQALILTLLSLFCAPIIVYK